LLSIGIFAQPILRASGIGAEQRPVLPPRRCRLLVEPVAHKEEQLGRLADHVIDEVRQREEGEQDRDDADDPDRPWCLRELLLRPPFAPPEAAKAGEEADAFSWHESHGVRRPVSRNVLRRRTLASLVRPTLAWSRKKDRYQVWAVIANIIWYNQTIDLGGIMEWDRLLLRERLGREGEEIPDRPGRSEFDSDVGRIVFSGAFRRLGRKTQVHPLAPNDHVHTRLTHSLEVAHVGRGLGKELGRKIISDLPQGYSPDDLGTIVHAACLAHDVGNPPFGHGGEKAMSYWFETNGPSIFEYLSPEYKRDLMSVEGNAQGFRVVSQIENHPFSGGLQLTYATLGAFHKYPWTSRKGEGKFGSYISEENLLNRVAEKLGLVATGDSSWCRHPLAYLVEAADDICYSIIDLEDAVELKILPFEKVADFFLAAFDETERKKFEMNLCGAITIALISRVCGVMFSTRRSQPPSKSTWKHTPRLWKGGMTKIFWSYSITLIQCSK
jgi:dGTP triphosphohydrolase